MSCAQPAKRCSSEGHELRAQLAAPISILHVILDHALPVAGQVADALDLWVQPSAASARQIKDSRGATIAEVHLLAEREVAVKMFVAAGIGR